MRVLQLGFGAVGRENVRQLLGKRHQVVGIVDTQDVIDAIDLGEFDFAEAPPPVLATDLVTCLSQTKPDVILQATTFDAGNMVDVVRAAASAGANLITINGIVDTEKLQPQLHAEIEALAGAAGIRVLGVGAIPGFFSDVVPLMLTGCCAQVRLGAGRDEALRLRAHPAGVRSGEPGRPDHAVQGAVAVCLVRCPRVALGGDRPA
jgi:hypothetical protein